MGCWKKVSEAFTSGMSGDRHKLMTELNCCYYTCPSNQPYAGARKSKMKFIERISPYAYRYKCRWCGCDNIFGADGPGVPHAEKPHIANPNFLFKRGT